MDMSEVRTVASVCPYCGVGCGIQMEVRDAKVVKVSGDREHPSNQGRLCTKGSTCAQPLSDPGRLRHAYLRPPRHGSGAPRDPIRADIDIAIHETASRLRTIIDQHGPDAVAFYVSGQMSLEAQYLANKLIKGYIGSNRIESNSRLCMASASSGYKLSLGADGPPGAYQDFEKADLFFVIGANMADCHPILFLRMMDRVKAGARLIVVDPRRTATADKAHLFMQIRPGTDLALLNGLLYLLHENGHTNADFIARHTEGWEAMPAFLADYTPDRVAALTGLNEDDIHLAAAMIGQAQEWMSCWTMGLNQSSHGTWNTNALCNLHLATGAICRPGSGPFSLTGQPNAMGGREMGYMGAGLPGQRSLLVEADRHFVEDTWGIPRGTLHTRLDGGVIELFQAMVEGQIKACWIICTNPVATVANRARVIEGLKACELVIVQDAFLDTETNRFADILLPGALWAEAEGVMVNSERNLTLMQQAVPPPGDALPDWQIIARVACAMGYEKAFTYPSAADVFEEIKRFHNPDTGYDLRGASHRRLRETPLQWPCPPNDPDDRHPIRYLNDGISQPRRLDSDGCVPRITFPTASGRARFYPRPHIDPAEMPDDDFPLVLNTGRVQHQWHTLTKTGRIATLNKLNPGPFVEIHPEDAVALDITGGQRVAIRSRRGQALLPARISDRVLPGHCFAPFHWNDVFGEDLAINAVTSDATDPVSQQPEFKVCAVSLTPVDAPRTECGDTQGSAEVDVSALGGSGILVLWASQTGNAESLAMDCAEQLRHSGLPVLLASMDTFPVNRLSLCPHILVLTSTFGDGEPPDNGVAFWRALQGEKALSLVHSRFAVFALGDASYDQFCGFGRQLDARLADLGAERLHPIVTCDGDFEEPAAQWIDELLTELQPDGEKRKAPLLRATPHGSSTTSYTKSRPFLSRLVNNQCLNSGNSGREIRHFALRLDDSFHYDAGDALGVWPRNCPELVDEILSRLKLSPDTLVSSEEGDVPLATALLTRYEIARVSPPLIEAIATQSRTGPLSELAKPGHETELKQWLWGRQLVDILHEHPDIRWNAAELLALLKPLQPRLYSISSSPKVADNEVHLTVSAVRYRRGQKLRKGVSSTFLADRARDSAIPIFLNRSPHFRPPADTRTAMIMIGPGTGIAPFRAFLHERRAVGAGGRNWLFFGAQHAATDFYYRDEIEYWRRDGFLTRLDLAFSRDQPQKIYVQDRMREQGAALWRWLQEGAHLYVCGDASRMARDVDQALNDIAVAHGGLSPQQADTYIRQLGRDKRYVRDVY